MILIIDDDSSIRSSLTFMLKRAGYETEAVPGPKEAIEVVRSTEPELILMDMNFSLSTSGEEGLTLLRQVRIFRPEVPVILMTAWGSIQLAVQGMQAGAFDFITKPWVNSAFLKSVETALALNRKEDIAPASNRGEMDGKFRFDKIIGRSPALLGVLNTIGRIAKTNASVLITGESGVGKESFPQIIHQYSRRKHGQYIAVNCGAIPEGTIDSELFGHEKGAFTGAIGERKGYFGEADGGTIFLDEVGELPLPTQARLLRVLESGEFIKVGSSKVQKTDVRIVAATNVNLTQAIAEGRFREDLYYRLNTVPIQIPPLRERGDDVLLLFRKFAADFAAKYRMPAIQLTEDAKKELLAYPWPGNVRQLKNITEQISIIETNREITAAILQTYLPAQNVQRLPALLGTRESKSFESEREILYSVLFDMRQEVAELRKMVHNMMAERAGQVAQMGQVGQVVATPVVTTANQPSVPAIIHPMQQATVCPKDDDDDIQDTEEYVEENLALDEVEKEMIRKALEKHHGKRKGAARDLKISERTLYRKIKEYELD